MANHKKDKQSCTLMNLMFMIAGLVLGMVLGYLVVPTIMKMIGFDDNTMAMTAPTMGAPTMGAPTMTAPTMGAPTMGAPTMGPPTMGPPTMAGGRRLFRNRFR